MDGRLEDGSVILEVGGLPITWSMRSVIAEQLVNYALTSRSLARPPLYSTSANGQVIAMCQDEPMLADEFRKADQILADGMPMVFVARWKYRLRGIERIATTDLYHDVARLAEERGLSFFLLGADENSNRLAIENTRKIYPNLVIAGRRNGYFVDEDAETVIAEINAAQPDILWVGMGVPREQRFISEHLGKMVNVGVVKTSGGLFDFLSEKRSRAPGWMQAAGLEWLYRALLEPRRLGRRYLATNHKALFKMIFDGNRRRLQMKTRKNQ